VEQPNGKRINTTTNTITSPCTNNSQHQ